MKSLQDFKNIHKNGDIYILASGKSVDFIDNSFFENKIVIGINQAYKKFECKYLVRKECKLIDTVLKDNKNAVHFISNGDCGGGNNKNTQFIKKNNYDKANNIVIYHHNNNTCKVPNNLPENDKLVTSYSTITTGIHLAAYMGAKNIILVGHDCGTLNGECNFKGYHTDETYKITWKNGKRDYKEWLKNIESQTIEVRRLIKDKYGCNIYSLNPFINFGLENNEYSK